MALESGILSLDRIQATLNNIDQNGKAAKANKDSPGSDESTAASSTTSSATSASKPPQQRQTDLSKAKPAQVLKYILQNVTLPTFSQDYFMPQGDRKKNVAPNILAAIEKGDLGLLHKILVKRVQRDQTLNICNAKGESLVHLACRTGHLSVLQFLVHEAKLSMRVQDDMGRSPMHDICWFGTTPKVDMVRFVVQHSPELLFHKDHRGFSPLDYVPHRWQPSWNQFLQGNHRWLRSNVALASSRQTRTSLQETYEKMQQILQAHNNNNN